MQQASCGSADGAPLDSSRLVDEMATVNQKLEAAERVAIMEGCGSCYGRAVVRVSVFITS